MPRRGQRDRHGVVWGPAPPRRARRARQRKRHLRRLPRYRVGSVAVDVRAPGTQEPHHHDTGRVLRLPRGTGDRAVAGSPRRRGPDHLRGARHGARGVTCLERNVVHEHRVPRCRLGRDTRGRSGLDRSVGVRGRVRRVPRHSATESHDGSELQPRGLPWRRSRILRGQPAFHLGRGPRPSYKRSHQLCAVGVTHESAKRSYSLRRRALGSGRRHRRLADNA